MCSVSLATHSDIFPKQLCRLMLLMEVKFVLCNTGTELLTTLRGAFQMQIFKLRRAESLLCVAVGKASTQLGLVSLTVRGGSGNVAGIWRNCIGPSALSCQIRFLTFSGETPTYFWAHQIQELQIGRWAVQGTVFTVVSDRTLCPRRISKSQKCWFIIYFGVGSVALYTAVELQYTLISYPFCSGIVLKIYAASREQCGTKWLSEVLIINMNFRTKKQVFSCLQLTLLHANDDRFIILRLLYVMYTDICTAVFDVRGWLMQPVRPRFYTARWQRTNLKVFRC
jgi:hypothetical protein